MFCATGDEDGVCTESDDCRGVVLCYCRRRLAVRSSADDAYLGFHWLLGRTGKRPLLALLSEWKMSGNMFDLDFSWQGEILVG